MFVSDIDELLDYLDLEDFDGITLSVGYTNASGDYNEFRITDICGSNEFGEEYIEAVCVDEDGESEDMERTFRISRFDFVEIIDNEDDEDYY